MRPRCGLLFLPFRLLPEKSLSWTLIATAATAAAPDPVPVRVFARGFALRASQTAWLLGAGASADAGVPTAGQLIDELLAVLYCSENGIRRADLTRDPRWQQRVRGFYDGRHGLPPLADNAFYSAIFEKVYPDRDARARFVIDQLAGRRPHPGQHMLAALVAAGLAPVLITTNFDTLLEDAIRPALDPDPAARLTVLDPESSTRAAFIDGDRRPPAADEDPRRPGRRHGQEHHRGAGRAGQAAPRRHLVRCSAGTACSSPGTAAATRQ